VLPVMAVSRTPTGRPASATGKPFRHATTRVLVVPVSKVTISIENPSRGSAVKFTELRAGKKPWKQRIERYYLKY